MSDLLYSQIWLNLVINDHPCNDITKLNFFNIKLFIRYRYILPLHMLFASHGCCKGEMNHERVSQVRNTTKRRRKGSSFIHSFIPTSNTLRVGRPQNKGPLAFRGDTEGA